MDAGEPRTEGSGVNRRRGSFLPLSMLKAQYGCDTLVAKKRTKETTDFSVFPETRRTSKQWAEFWEVLLHVRPAERESQQARLPA